MSTTLYAVEFRAPHQLAIGLDSVVSCRVEGPSGYVVASAATCTVYDEDGGTAIATPACTIGVDGTITATLLAASTLGLTASSAWLVEWVLTVEGKAITAANTAILAPYILRCPVTSGMLQDGEPTFADGLPDGQTTWRPQIDDVWDAVLTRLLAEQRNPHEIRNVSALIPATLAWSRAAAARALSTYLPDGAGMVRKASEYQVVGDDAWARMRLEGDADGDGLVDNDNVRPGNPMASTAASRWFGSA